MKVSIANSSVSPHVKQNVMAYYEASQLTLFYTSFFYHPHNKLAGFLNNFKFIREDLNRRAFTELPIHFFRKRPVPELIRSFSSRKLNAVITDKIWEWAELSFDKWVSKELLKNKPNIIHTYEHSALETLKVAKQHHIFTVYEQISQHHTFFKTIIDQQFSQFPLLKSGINNLLTNEKAIIRNQKRDEELKLADLILCNSTFTKRTLLQAGIDDNKIKIIPLGFPVPLNKVPSKSKNKPFRFLFAGMQSLRKGTHLLFEAWRSCAFQVGEAELWLIGGTNEELKLGKPLPDNVMIKDSIPHTQLMEFYKEVDVFILPTLADGFGMVVTEAMSQGVPVITTTNSCGPDIIDNGKNGWIIEAGSIHAIVNILKLVFDKRNEIAMYKEAALAKAKSWQWKDYRMALTELIATEWEKRK